MATSATRQPAAPAAAAPAPGKKLIIALLVALLLLLLLGGAAAAYYFFFMPHGSQATEKQVEKLPPPVFFAIDPFTVNLQSDDGGERYLHVGLTLKLASQNVADDLKEHMPEIRSRILILLSNKHPSDLTSLDGKNGLASEIRAQIEAPYSPGDKPIHVDDVLFTDFVVQ